MDTRQKYATQAAFIKLFNEGFEGTKDELQAEFDEVGADGLTAKFGEDEYVIRRVTPKPRPAAYEDEADFLGFMRAKGMTVETVKPEWRDNAAIVAGKVVWADTGEVIPHAYVEQRGAYLKLKDPRAEACADVLNSAVNAGALDGGVLKLLGGGDE